MKVIPAAPALVILIGPTGAGKSTWAAKHFTEDEVIDTDAVRIEFGEARGMSRDNLATLFKSVWETEEQQIIEEYHRRIKAGIDDEKRVVAEASHLRKEVRLKVANIGLTCNVPVIYVVFDRPREDKLKTAGWRAEAPIINGLGIIDRYAKRFEANEADILCGDNISTITVIDTRSEGYHVVP